MVNISFLGGCREVGRSAILIESKSGVKCMLDYGIRFRGEERLPYKINIDNLKAVALTHSHIDHSGALPFLYKTKTIPFFTNPITLAITEVLIKDMIKISNYNYPFGYRELDYLIQNSFFLKNGNRQKIHDNFFITFFDAGHIPGSVSILIEVDNKKILYSGDINSQITNLINPANSNNIPKIDTLIIESTYALKEHPPREKLEKEFVEKIINITDNGGRVLIPAFGVARSQEALLILEKFNYNGKIFIDGLARKISMLYLDYPDYIKNIKLFKKALKNTQFVSRPKIRSKVKNTNGVIISPSGMLKGGTAIDYIQSILLDPFSAVYLVGYQVEGTPGRRLLDDGIFEFNESRRNRKTIVDLKIEAKCDYDYFDFSSHSDNIHIHNYIENLNFQKNSNRDIFCIHGDNKSTTSLASELVNKDYNSVAPETGEMYQV
ncbi:MAG: MBL fold metallo-hydrolase [Candidatus Lokiarchaeota archaeon]|nr:MBL fold metallo-hydrolase [Candidatus Lokiarchaeota archaeon]